MENCDRFVLPDTIVENQEQGIKRRFLLGNLKVLTQLQTAEHVNVLALAMFVIHDHVVDTFGKVGDDEILHYQIQLKIIEPKVSEMRQGKTSTKVLDLDVNPNLGRWNGMRLLDIDIDEITIIHHCVLVRLMGIEFVGNDLVGNDLLGRDAIDVLLDKLITKRRCSIAAHRPANHHASVGCRDEYSILPLKYAL